jgi:hypothetical protein
MSAAAIPCAASALSTRRVRDDVSAIANAAVLCVVLTPRLRNALSFAAVTVAVPVTVSVR